MKHRFVLLTIFGLFLLSVAVPVAAQDNEPAQVRFGHFVWDGVPVNAYIDEAVFTGSGTTAFPLEPSSISSSYVEVTPGVHTFAVVPDGEALEAPIFDPEELTLEAGRSYLLAMMGNVAADDLHLTLMDETAALEQLDISVSAVSIVVNNIYGIPALDAYFAGEQVVENLAYGDYVFTQDRTEGSGTLVTPHGDAQTTIFEFEGAVASPSDVFAVFAFEGTFPGTMWEDYTALYIVEYLGELTFVDGEAIAVGDAVPTNITEHGQRIQYTLTLEAAATLDILMTDALAADGEDAYLRIYDAAGDVIYEGDELSMDDNAEGIYDAGVQGLALDAGVYTIEAATFVDSYPGTYTVSVSESE